MPVFLVGDYLDKPLQLDSATLEKSFTWTWIRAAKQRAVRLCSRLTDLTAVSGSRLAANLLAIRSSDRLAVRRQATAVILLFVSAYYPVRFILLALFPSASAYAGIGAGLALGLILSALLLLVSGK